MRNKITIELLKRHKCRFIILFMTVNITSFISTLYPHIFGMLIDGFQTNNNLSKFYKTVILYGLLFIVEQSIHFILNHELY